VEGKGGVLAQREDGLVAVSPVYQEYRLTRVEVAAA
jgi:hypothetical protein